MNLLNESLNQCSENDMYLKFLLCFGISFIILVLIGFIWLFSYLNYKDQIPYKSNLKTAAIIFGFVSGISLIYTLYCPIKTYKKLKNFNAYD